MLYDHWLNVAKTRWNDLALSEEASGRTWTFGQLAEAGEQETGTDGPVVFLQGQSSQFVLNMLAAWRMNKPACALEIGQKPPAILSLPEHCCHIKTTSATTTGNSRLIAFSADQLVADATNIVTTMGLRPDWPNLAAISLAHSYGFANLVLPLLLHGVPLILASSALPEAIRRASTGHGSLSLSSVPALWRTWNDAGCIPSSVKLAISAGAPLPVSLEQQVFQSSGIKIHNFYGSSECGGIAYDRNEEPRTHDSFVGTPLNNVELGINQHGCLYVKGPAVGMGYLDAPDTRLQNGEFHTNDLAEIVDTKVFLRGRASDVLNIAGRKLSPETVENTLRKHPLVKDCLILGIPHASHEGREVVAAVVATRQDISAMTLQQYLHDFLPDWQIPRAWMFVQDLETNARGKVSRMEWRTRFEQLSR